LATENPEIESVSLDTVSISVTGAKGTAGGLELGREARGAMELLDDNRRLSIS